MADIVDPFKKRAAPRPVGPTRSEERALEARAKQESIQSANMSQATAAADLAKAPIDRARAAQALKVDQATTPAQIAITQAEAERKQIELEKLRKERGFLTPQEQQALAANRVVLMIEGERQYKRALERGYRPDALGNKVTALLDKVPIVGKEAATLLRDPKAELAVQGERTFRQGALRSLTGAGDRKEEGPTVGEIYFPSPFQSNDKELRDQLAALRARQIATMKTAAGPALAPEQGATLPPAVVARLKEGVVTTFSNGQKWTKQGGKPKRVQ